MALKVYGHVITPAVQRVMVYLAEKELEYKYIPVNIFAGDHKKQPYLSLNPFGLVPAFKDGDVTLFESRAIIRYIEETYKGKTHLTLDDPKKMGAVYTWMETEALHFDPAAMKLVFQLCTTQVLGIPMNEALVAENQGKLNSVLDVYEDRLSKSRYLGADSFTMADLFHLPGINSLMSTKLRPMFEDRPHVNAWVNDILARPSWAEIIALKKSQS
ncbi:OLC1v1004268C1 [Oldenlandia corymbosa var. corymbosa]|uniref:glutathione transferase n=1 Tax=Oldenlandia corymbosa var. corymbosa TaxID=529605 RepID=A0AAV1DEC2_OLDCO|nr:OLC1v1004268C1 [Oldenlandia corymbosa var. corymbosa]